MKKRMPNLWVIGALIAASSPITIFAQESQTTASAKKSIALFSFKKGSNNHTSNGYKVAPVPITGKILNDQGEPLVGATITVKGGTATTTADAEGAFTLDVPDANATLIITYTGYQTQEISLNNRTTISITLISSNNLESVVVVGYGTRRKTNVTGAIASINNEQIRSVPTTNLSQALQGRVPGVEVMANSFRPGSGSRVRIRGNRSLFATNEPLYVVDGIPVTYTIDDMNPADIENVDVLKDASATAIYGVRGANGVVQITTKKARAGKVSVTYDGNVSFDNILKHLPVFTAPQLADAWRQAFFADRVYNFAQNTNAPNNYFPNAAADAKLFGGTTGNAMWEFIKDAYQFTTFDRATNTYVAVKRPTTQEERDLLKNLGLPVLTEVDAYDPSRIKSFNWQDAAIRQGITNQHSVNVSVGSDKIRSSFSGSYFKQKGIEYGQDYTRYTVGNNTEFRPLKFLTFGNSISYTNGVQNVGPSLYGNASGQLPFTRPYDTAGIFDLYPNDDQQIVNGLNDVNTVFNEIRTSRIFGNIFAEVTLFKGLRYRTVFGLDSRNTRQGRFNGALSSVRQGNLANASYDLANNTSWVYDNLLYYDLNIGKDHQFNVTLLHEMQTFNQTDSMSMSAQNLIFEEQRWYSLQNNTLATVTGTGNYSKSQLLSYMGRVEYAFKNKYLVTLSARYDNASVFVNKKGASFPSAAIAWKVDSEEFFSKQDIFSHAKVRVGIGSVGNSSIGPYQTNGPLGFTLYNWGNGAAAIGSAPNTFAVPEITWEKTTTRNLGLEFGLFNNRINATVDLYSSSSVNQLQRLAIPTANGVSFLPVNLGEVSNKGVELSLNTVNINTPGGLRWTTDIVFSKNKEAIVSVDGSTGSDNLANLLFVGQPIRSYYNYQSAGIYQYADTARGGYLDEYLWKKGSNRTNANYRPGRIRVVDVNGDTLINASDKMVLGSDNATWTGSIGNTISYKNFDLNFLIYVRKGGMYRVPRPGLVGRYQSSYANYWTPTNPSTEYQQPTRTTDIPIYWESLGYRDGSFVRVRNISLTYRFPPSLLSRMKVSNLAVYVNAVNPFLFHDASPYDPETVPYTESFAASTGNPGPNSYSYRSMVLGIRLGL